MATVSTMTMLLPPQPALNRYSRASTIVDSTQLAERFWKSVKLDSPTSPTFESGLFDSPIDEKAMCVVHVEDTTSTFIDDPIVAFETLDCYSPNRPTFSPVSQSDNTDTRAYQPCPYGETLGLYANPAPTLGSIRYHDKPPSRHASPWSAMTLRPTRFRSTSNAKQTPSVLALASAFLDSIVRLARSRSSTPTTFNDGQGPVTILESEVLINVLEDGKRAALGKATDEKLDLLPSLAIRSLGALWDIASPTASTEGSDFMNRVGRERHSDPPPARGRLGCEPTKHAMERTGSF